MLKLSLELIALIFCSFPFLKVGTKSILFGAHCFFLHPFFVAWGWYKLYGFPTDLRLWMAFFVHDLGYWGKPNMDGEEGELHPYFGAKIMHKLFDKIYKHPNICDSCICDFCLSQYKLDCEKSNYWFNFTLYHSRFLAKKNNAQYSKLCVADKYAICLTPSWLYVPMTMISSEIYEYVSMSKENNNGLKASINKLFAWHKGVKKHVEAWVMEHKEIKQDTWTPNKRTSINDDGVWK